MRSTFGGLEIAKRSLFTHQSSLQTTGHNLANANTVGYSRQVVNHVAAQPLEAIGMNRSTIPGQIGQGVEFDYIKRIRDGFLDQQYYNENKGLGEWTVRKDTLEKLEAIINEPSDTGFRQVLDNYWNAWQELSKLPDNLETRSVVKESALALADSFNHIAKKMNDLNSDLTDNINVKTQEVNSILSQISALNEGIYRIEGFGNNANDLRDQRDVLADNLSRLVNVDVVEADQGYVISMGTTVLVNGRESSIFDNSTVMDGYASGSLNSGELYGLVLSRDGYLAEDRNQFNAMALTLAKSVNEIHKTGYTLGDPLTIGGDFFVIGDVNNAALTLDLSQTIKDNIENIAASKRFTTDVNNVNHVVRGNNDLALEMASLKNTQLNFELPDGTPVVLNGGTFDEFLRALVTGLGVQTQEAIRQTTNQTVLLDQVDGRRQSVSGVSQDEEISNMIKFQHAYNAAARAMTVFDEMLDKVINGMGVVGR